MHPSKKLKVAIQGIRTSFHEIAAHRYFGENIETIECLSFYTLCEALKKDDADYAVMAIENAIAGSILPNYFLLQDYHFKIVGEIYLPIQMHLLALPGVRLEDITTIESHPMAIRQCSLYLNQLQGVQLIESEDTALSAMKVSELQLRTTAAIANEYAAKQFGLEIIEKRIETNKKNFTRFLILTKKANKNTEINNKASIYFDVAHEVGSLADTLTILKEHHINLLKIQSIPIIGKPSEYSIHLDIEWTDRTHYDATIQQLLRQVRNLNILGEYQKATLQLN
jgi:prephenate dehydratase